MSDSTAPAVDPGPKAPQHRYSLLRCRCPRHCSAGSAWNASRVFATRAFLSSTPPLREASGAARVVQETSTLLNGIAAQRHHCLAHRTWSHAVKRVQRTPFESRLLACLPDVHTMVETRPHHASGSPQFLTSLPGAQRRPIAVNQRVVGSNPTWGAN